MSLPFISWTAAERRLFLSRWSIPICIAVLCLIVNQSMLSYLDAGRGFQIGSAVVFLLILFGGTATLGFVFIYRVMVPITFGLIFLAIYRYAYDPVDGPRWMAEFFLASDKNFKYLQLLFDMTSVLYAICTAFLLWKGLTDHDKLREYLGDEANHIERFSGYLRYFNLDLAENRNFCREILENFQIYIQNILNGEEIKVSQENAVIIRRCSQLISKLNPEDANDRIALSEIMKSLSDLASARSKRISQMEVRMSPFLIFALMTMSFSILYPFYTQFSFEPGENYIRETCIFALGSLLSFLIVTLYDISQPFNGFWKIKTEAFESIMELIDVELAELKEADVTTPEQQSTNNGTQ